MLLFVFSLLAIDAYEPLRDGHYDNFDYDEARWITIPAAHPTCNLRNRGGRGANWIGETHPDIVGVGAVQGELARYYIKKRLGQNNRVQFVALRNPQAPFLVGNRPDEFETQLATIFCKWGTLEQVTVRQPQYKLCDIEEKLVALCLLNREDEDDTLTKLDPNQVFAQREHANTDAANLDNMRNLVEEHCLKFFRIKLPERGGTLEQRQVLVTKYLTGAQRADFYWY